MTITRDQFYKHFGPKQMETVMRYLIQEVHVLRSERNGLGAGIIRLIVPQLNVLRAEHNMTEITIDQALTALENDIGVLEPLDKDTVLDELKDIWDSLPDYDWMED